MSASRANTGVYPGPRLTTLALWTGDLLSELVSKGGLFPANEKQIARAGATMTTRYLHISCSCSSVLAGDWSPYKSQVLYRRFWLSSLRPTTPEYIQ